MQAPKTCTTTGTGMSKKRWLVASASPVASSATRNTPAAPGTKVSASRLAGIHHSRRTRVGAAGRNEVVVMATSLAAGDVTDIGPQAGLPRPIGRVSGLAALAPQPPTRQRGSADL